MLRAGIPRVSRVAILARPSHSTALRLRRAVHTTQTLDLLSHRSARVPSAHTRRLYSSAATAEDNNTTTKKACTKCDKPLALAELSCPDCGSLQALPTSLDAYDLLGIDFANIGANGWKVDLGELKLQWRKRVALSHPDRMGGKDQVGSNLFLPDGCYLSSPF